MSIRAIILLALLPAFVILGLLSSIIEHVLVKQELTWGLKEQSFAVATGIAAFLDRESENFTEAEHEKKLSKIPFILNNGFVWRVDIINKTDGKIINSFGNQTERPKQFIESEAEITNSAGSGIATVRVLTDATAIYTELATLKNALILRIVCLAALALPVGWIFGSLFIGKIKRSKLRAEQILQNPVSNTIRQTKILELDDVNETIEILAALLEERHALQTLHLKSKEPDITGKQL